MRLPWWTWILPVILIAVLAVSCGGGDDGPATKARTSVSVACDPIAEMSSYRYSVNVKLQESAATQAAAGGASIPATPAPLSALTQALSALFTDFTLDGAYVSPGRSQAILRFQGEELEFRTIGDKSWVRMGTAWQDAKSSDTGLLTPTVLCQQVISEIAGSLDAGDSDRQTTNGIETDHYHLDQTGLQRLPAGLAARLPQKYALDLWLARDGRWPVHLQIDSADVDERGEPVGFQLSMSVRDAGDKGISVERPVP